MRVFLLFICSIVIFLLFINYDVSITEEGEVTDFIDDTVIGYMPGIYVYDVSDVDMRYASVLGKKILLSKVTSKYTAKYSYLVTFDSKTLEELGIKISLDTLIVSRDTALNYRNLALYPTVLDKSSTILLKSKALAYQIARDSFENTIKLKQ